MRRSSNLDPNTATAIIDDSTVCYSPSVRTLIGSGIASITGIATLIVTLTTTLAAQTPPRQPQASATSNSQAPTAVDQRYRYRLLGVYDEATGEPVEGVEVSDVLAGVSALTTKTGTVSLFFLPDGGSLVRLRKVGYEMQTLTVAITPSDTNPLTVILSKAVQLAAVKVKAPASSYLSPTLAGAEERMNSHQGGYFISEAEMRKHDASTMANTISSRIAGLMRVPGPRGAAYFISSRAQSAGTVRNSCYVSVWINGVPSAVNPPDFNVMLPSDYAIAEFYPGEASVPIEFSTTGTKSGTKCGVLLLWTREK